MLLDPTCATERDFSKSTPATNSGPIDILIVDDELMIRTVLELALKSRGLRVRTAATCEDAVGLFHQHGGDVGLVLLDVRMPKVDGPHVFHELNAIDPGVRVMFMTGDPGGYSNQELLALGALGVLEKPFANLISTAAHLQSIVEGATAQLR